MNMPNISLKKISSLVEDFYERIKDNPCYRGVSKEIHDEIFRIRAIQDLYNKFQSEVDLTGQQITDELAGNILFKKMIRFEPNNPSDEITRKHFVSKLSQSKNTKIMLQFPAIFDWMTEFAIATCRTRFSSVKYDSDEFVNSVILREEIVDPENAENKVCFTIINRTESIFYISEKFRCFLNGRPIGDSKKFSVLPKDGQIAIFEYFGQTYISLRQKDEEEQHLCITEIDGRLLPFPSRKEDIPKIALRAVPHIKEHLHQKYSSLSIQDRDICIEKIVYQHPFTTHPFEITFSHVPEGNIDRDTISLPEIFTLNDLNETIHSLIPMEMYDSIPSVIIQDVFDPNNPGKIIRFEIVNYTETQFYVSDECISDKLTIHLEGIAIKQSSKLCLFPKNAQIVIFKHFGQIYISRMHEDSNQQHICVAQLSGQLTAFPSRIEEVKGVAIKSLDYITEQLKRKFPFDCIENVSIDKVIYREYITASPFKITYSFNGKTTDIFYSAEKEFAEIKPYQFTGKVPHIEKYPQEDLKTAISELFGDTYENIEVLLVKRNVWYTLQINPDQTNFEHYFNPYKKISYDIVVKLNDKEKRLLVQNTDAYIDTGVQEYKTIEISFDTRVEREFDPATLPLLKLIPAASRRNKIPKNTRQQLLIVDNFPFRLDILNFTDKTILFNEKLSLEIEGNRHNLFRHKFVKKGEGQLIAFEYYGILYLAFQNIFQDDHRKKSLPYVAFAYSAEADDYIEIPKLKDLVHFEENSYEFVSKELKLKFPDKEISKGDIKITKIYPTVFNKDFGWVKTGYREKSITQTGFVIEYTYQDQDYSSEFIKKNPGIVKKIKWRDAVNPLIPSLASKALSSLSSHIIFRSYDSVTIYLINYTNKIIAFKKNAITVNGVKLENSLGNSKIHFENSFYTAFEYYGSMYLFEKRLPEMNAEKDTGNLTRMIGISENRGHLSYGEYDFKLLENVIETTGSFALDALRLKFPLREIHREEVIMLRIKPQIFDSNSWGFPGKKRNDFINTYPGFVVIFEYEGKKYHVHTPDGNHCKTIDLDFEPYSMERLHIALIYLSKILSENIDLKNCELLKIKSGMCPLRSLEECDDIDIFMEQQQLEKRYAFHIFYAGKEYTICVNDAGKLIYIHIKSKKGDWVSLCAKSRRVTKIR